MDNQRRLHSAILNGYQCELRQLEAACDEQGQQQLDQLAERMIRQIEVLRCLCYQHEDILAELKDAVMELASLNAIYGTTYQLVCPPPRDLQADEEDIEVLRQFSAFRDSLHDEELQEAVEELKRCYYGKAKAVARSRDSLRRRQIQLSRLEAFRAELGVEQDG